MSTDTKENIWVMLAREKYPKLSEHVLQGLSMRAASEWYNGDETDLAKLFDQYVMIKNLKGL